MRGTRSTSSPSCSTAITTCTRSGGYMEKIETAFSALIEWLFEPFDDPLMEEES